MTGGILEEGRGLGGRGIEFLVGGIELVERAGVRFLMLPALRLFGLFGDGEVVLVIGEAEELFAGLVRIGRR